ncbi:MAG TPA: hypothetical protein DEA55_02985 [Rhodospirillaceae bacterium]|nr:hypothetical protein [Rhodospirillaceae bacterium]
MNVTNIIKIILIIAAIFMAAPCALAQQDQEPPKFFSSLQDVPLMPGLRELTDYAVMFDKPEGRIIESVAAVDSLTRESIRAYYEASLPQFGWKRIGKDNFARQGEYLRLGFEAVEGQDFLKITIMPHG